MNWLTISSRPFLINRTFKTDQTFKTEMKTTSLRVLIALASALVVGMAPTAEAAPFSFSTTLTGDIRPGSPDNILIDVDVVGDTTQDFVDFTVDLNMGLAHPDAKLLSFFLNLSGDSEDYAFSNFSPTDWDLLGTDVNAGGSGGAQFMFHVGDSPGVPHQDVTNSVLLTFRVTKLTGNFFATDFTNAPESCGDAGCGQMGAHVGSLTPLQGVSSGFATGIYSGQRLQQVPEPGSMLLTSAGLLAVTRFVRRRRRS